MTTQQLTMIWDHIRKMNGITMRLVSALPADRLDDRPIPNMRTPKELLVHLYGMNIRGVTEGILRGEIQEIDEAGVAWTIRTLDDLTAYCTDCWKAADRAIAQVTDAHLAAQVQTPWGMAMPGFVCVQVIRDELTHHRGQLFCYERALGVKEVPMMWDFEHNAPEYQPKQHATA